MFIMRLLVFSKYPLSLSLSKTATNIRLVNQAPTNDHVWFDIAQLHIYIAYHTAISQLTVQQQWYMNHLLNLTILHHYIL